ncbi:hypothetical protein K4L06_22370 [Lysobacter sp. BMK333-48F3]|uniref:hypothetical protein n=1 Tax=Lysobacter sp. BMK333-48F3 TaxID=2867962 RepID=UPI001C8BD57E|nr:hypothetical protein [Lysobacter sp. BMK333-48F3]MBX9404053.1 hypothetical protein [Lysobacter sp. BMK333-48F3]
MTDEEISRLISENLEYGLPDFLLHRDFALALVESGDPMFLLKVPEPYRTAVVELGKEVTDQWFEISNNGVIDRSAHAGALHSLVMKFLSDVPLGQFRDWNGPKRVRNGD